MTLSNWVVGIPTATTANVAVTVTATTSVRLKVGTDAAVTAGVIYGPAATPDGLGNAQLTVSGLTAGVRYYYRVAMTPSGGGAETLDTGTVGQFRAAPVGQVSFAFCFGSCTAAVDSPAFAAISARGDDLFFHLGDLFYADGQTNSLDNYRSQIRQKVQAANAAALYSTTPSAFTPSDHDGMADASTAGDAPVNWANYNAAYRELLPAVGLPGSGVYSTFTWGRVRFIQLDDRSFKTTRMDADSPAKTALGAVQKQWLKDTITAATEPVIVIAQSAPWIRSGPVATDDGWAGYVTERAELAGFFAASGKNIVMLAGDMHAVAADDGSNSPGGVAVFHAAPFAGTSSQRGGPYTTGPYPASGATSVQQYGRVVVTDSGSQIALAFTGYSADNTARVSLTKTFTVDPPVPTGSTVTVLHAMSGLLKRKGRPDRTPGTPAVPTYGPVSVADVNEFESRGLGTPIDANYVMWSHPTGTDLWAVFNSLGANDILVLPEDENPYVVNQMYRTADGTPTGTNPTTDRSASRSRRGVIGLGPNAIIAPAASFPTYPAQTGQSGVREALIENWTAGSYHANFTIRGRNVGGLAFHGLKLDTSDGLVERVKTVNHYGFQNFEPGEAFGIMAQNAAAGTTTTIRSCEIDGRNPDTGLREGAGGIHLVKGAAVLVDRCHVHDVRGHGIAHYWRLGTTEIRDSLIAGIGTSEVHGRGINVEVCGTNDITLNNTSIQMGSAASGNVGAHLAVVSANQTGTAGAWPLGATQLYVNDLGHDEATVKAWHGTGGTYMGAPNVAAPADFHFAPAGTPVTYSGFQG